MNLYVKVAGKPFSTPVWVAVAVNDPSDAIAMLEMLNEESLKAGAWCAVEAVGVRHRDILDLCPIRRDVEPVSGAGVIRAGVAPGRWWARSLASLQLPRHRHRLGARRAAVGDAVVVADVLPDLAGHSLNTG